jgi:translocation and assembly module TamB
MSRAKRIRRVLLVVVAIVILLPVTLLAVAYVTLRTETGTAWVLEQIEGLSVESGEGSILATWQAERLQWVGFGVQLDVAEPKLAWRPSCLLQKTVCLDALVAKSIDMKLAPAETADAGEPGPVSLPAVDIPLAVTIAEVRLGDFRLNDTLLWDSLDLSAQASGSSVTIADFRVERDTLAVGITGRLETRGDWPLNLDVLASVPPPEGDDWTLDLALAGSIADLRLSGQSSGYLDAELDGRLAPLKTELPAQLNLKSGRFLALASLPPALALEDWALTLDGNLADGFRVNSEGRLPAERGAMEFALGGLVTTENATDLSLTLSAPYHRDGKTSDVNLQGEVDWSDDIAAETRFRLQSFPWYDLLPDMEPLPVALSKLSGRAGYKAGQYTAELSAQATGPVGVTTLETALEGDLSEVRLNMLKVDTGAGSLDGKATIAFADQLAWQADLALKRFNPGFWVPELEADLSGKITSKGSLGPGGQPDLEAEWNLAGTWRGQKTRTRAELSGANAQWAVENLELAVGNNRISGQGRWADQLVAKLDLNMPDLSVFLPGLEGQLTGNASAEGQPDRASGRLVLDARNIRWQESVSVASLSVEASLSDSESVQADVKAGGLMAADQELRAVDLGLTGSVENHQLAIAVINEQVEARLEFGGGWNDGWRGRVSEGRLALPTQDQVWDLTGPAPLEYAPEGRLALGEHCWQWQQSSLCAGDQTLLPTPSLNYRLRQFPAEALSALFPENLRWQAMIDGDLVMEIADTGPDGRIDIDAGPGEVSVKIKDEWKPIRYDTLTTRVTLSPSQADLALDLSGPDLTALSLAMTIDPSDKDLPVDGEFRLEGLDVALAGAFSGIEDIGGQLDGEGRFNGALRDPLLQGQLTLSEGRIMDPSLPMPLEKIALKLEFDGRQAGIQGRWQSNGEGTGQIQGEIAWRGQPSVNLRITGKRLPVTYEPYAYVELAPDISIAFEQGDLRISGSVDVPRGNIEIRELPAQTVTVSDDEEIVGQQKEPPALRELSMDVTVRVGADKVSFKGFGVTGNLEGTLRIGNNMDTRGSLQMVDGAYEAYGQELTLRRARVVFVGPISEPYLEIEATRQVKTVTAGIRLTGPATAPSAEVFSEPPMTESEALSYLVLGRPLRGGQQEDGQLSQAALSLGLAKTGGVTRKLGQGVGIENLVLETEGSGDSASVVASGDISEKLSVRYGVGVFEPVTKVALRYDLGRYFFVEAASGLAASLDLFYTRDF